MKPFLLTIVGPFQTPNPPYFQSLVCNKAFRVFFSKLMAFSEDFIAVTLHRTLNFFPLSPSLSSRFRGKKKEGKKYMVPAEVSLLSRWETISRKAQVCCSAAIRLMFVHLHGFEVERKPIWAS